MEKKKPFKGDCDKGIHWYAGVYRDGFWVYNECSYCKKIDHERREEERLNNFLI